MQDFKIFSLGDVANIQIGPFGSQLHKKDYVDFGTPIVTVEHLGNRNFTENNLPLVSDSDKERLKKFVLCEGDIVFSRVGSVDRCSYVSKNYAGWLFSGRCLRVRANEKIYPLFLYYFFCLKSTKQNIINISVGTTMPSLNTKLLGEIEVKVPPLEVQKKIAAVLSSLDDKIELNNKINQNLEQQAQAIFDKFYKSADKKIFSVSSLDKIANYLNGLAMQKFRPAENEIGLPVLKIKELRQGFCDENSDRCTEKIKSDFVVDDGDIIFSWSGTLLVDFWCGGKCGLNQHLFKVTSKKYGKWFCYLWTKKYLKSFQKSAADMATTMGHIKRENLSKSKVLIPNEENYLKLENYLKPIFDKIINNRIENKRLAEMRDLLLPRLLNGEIDASKVEV